MAGQKGNYIMEDLVFIHDFKSEPYTTSDIVSEFSGVKPKRIRELITRHFNDFEELGGFSFEWAKPMKGSQGGRPHRIYQLTETHVTFLFTLLDNTPQVVKFNLLIAKAFKELKKRVAEQQQEIADKNILLERNRKTNKDLGQVIHDYLPDNPYAYSNYHTLAYKTVTGFTPRKLRDMYHVSHAQDALTNEQVERLEQVKQAIASLIMIGQDYQTIQLAISKPA
ncbi:hypothetical protein EFL35_04135 [Weissella paramesenteroides]|jgi:phage regulator Rha-like protein|nr:hypothetical protein [Weissella paramesenteroides]MCS9998773.1 hypothetical protein [Weissella paramesenteroides]MCT0260266.1 hypothetical protein [Weissella paramesenteroides]